MSAREKDAIDNFNYVIEELIKIDKLKEAVQEDKRKHILEGDFY